MAPRRVVHSTNSSEQASYVRRGTPSITKRSSFKLRYVIVLLVCGWAAYHYWSVQHAQLVRLQGQMSTLQTNLNQAKLRQTALTKQVAEFQNTSFIARYASQQFNLIEPKQVSFELTH